MTTEVIDLGLCPHCAEDLYPVALEWVPAAVMIDWDPATVQAQWGGQADLAWGEAIIECYFCGACGEVLPEELQTWLDRLLGTERWEIHRRKRGEDR